MDNKTVNTKPKLQWIIYYILKIFLQNKNKVA
jgi:hypothetical protein